MKHSKIITIIAAIAVGSASMSTTVNAFHFGGFFKKLAHKAKHAVRHAGKKFGHLAKGLAHSPIANMALQAGEAAATEEISRRMGPEAGQMAGGLFGEANRHLHHAEHHRHMAEEAEERGDEEQARYHREQERHHRHHHEQKRREFEEMTGEDYEDHYHRHVAKHFPEYEEGSNYDEYQDEGEGDEDW